MWGRLRRWLRALARRGALGRELDEELRHHLERQMESNVAAGMTREEARLAALRDFGGVQQAKEECRSARGTGLVEELFQDVRYGMRVLSKAPGFTFAAAALLPALTGLYGVMAYTVSRRRQQSGVRMALGAWPFNILKQMLGQGLRLALAGVAAGSAPRSFARAFRHTFCSTWARTTL